jgi:hypothetical protein
MSKPSGLLVGIAIFLIAVGIVWILVVPRDEHLFFGGILLGLGFLVGVTGWVLSLNRR